MKSLRELMQARRAEKVPRGWCTPLQFARREGFAELDGHFYRIVAFGIKQGFVQRRKFQIKTGCGVKSVSHYRRVK